ncbi:MAG: hypothetical protein ACJ72E_00810 [Marmoricola sp.]
MRPLALLTAGMLLVSGCGGLADGRAASSAGHATPPVKEIAGDRVAAMAEEQLESEHPALAVGRITCPDLVVAIGTAVRCARVADLGDGRRIRELGTVTVTSLSDGVRLHVALDEDVDEFGVTGAHLADDLTTHLRGAAPGSARCPYLRGASGRAVRCTVRVGGRAMSVRVVVTGVDAGAEQTRYRFDLTALPKAVQRRLAYVATEPSAVVDWPRDHRSRAAA